MDKHLAIVFWNLGIGGIQTRVSSIIARTLEKYPQTQITLLLYERKAQEVKILNHPSVSVLTFPGPVIIKAWGLKKRFWRLTTVQLILWVYYQLTVKKPTHVMTFLNRFSFFIALYVFFKRIVGRNPVYIINEPVVISAYLKQHESIWWRLLVVFSYKVANKIIVATNSVKQDLTKQFKVDPNKIIVIKSWTQDK